MDPSLTVRFANLPNNCQLQLKQRSGPRTSGEVSIAVQTDSGQRTTGKFSSEDTLHHVIINTVGIPAIGKGKELVCVYTRREIVGEEPLRTTTLSSLGLTSGSAVLRITTRDKGMAHVQAHVEDLKLKKAPAPGPSKTEEVVADVKQNVSKFGKSLKKMMSGVFEGSSDSKKGSKEDEGGRRLGSASDSVPAATSSSTPAPSSQPAKQKLTKQTTFEHDYPINSEIVWLGDREALMFKLEDMQRMSSARNESTSDLPDDFFQVTQDDVILMYQDLKATISDLENRPLETRQLREKRRQTTRYSKTVLRICFPSEGLFLQGIFVPTETISVVSDWVRTFLADSKTQFYLYTTPPKEVLQGNWTLIEKKLVPAAVIHFGQNQASESGVFRKDLYNQITSFEAISAATKKLRDEVTKTLVDVPAVNLSSSISSQVEATSQPQREERAPVSSSQDQKIPKWFKPGK